MNTKNGQEMPKKPQGPGELFIVATPIGNLQDMTPRAVRALSDADFILCEDTRVTLRLLHAYGIDKRLERADQHVSPEQLQAWVERLLVGEKLAFVSDAGTPAISDPGAELVKLAAEAGITVTPIPGPSALTTFLSAAGFTTGSPLFRGFFPRKQGDREAEWVKVSGLPFSAAVVWFESPERIEETITFLAERAPEVSAVIGKELTKIHEKFYRGKLKDLTSHILRARAAGEIRGEWVIGLLIAENEMLTSDNNSADWEKALRSLLNSGISASRAAREVSQVFGIQKKIVYAAAIKKN